MYLRKDGDIRRLGTKEEILSRKTTLERHRDELEYCCLGCVRNWMVLGPESKVGILANIYI